MSTRRMRRTREESAPIQRPYRSADHLLELLTYSGWPLTISELREHGIPAPGQTIYELQVAGYEIDRVPVRHDGHESSGYRLHPPPGDEPSRADSGRSPDRSPQSRAGRTVALVRRHAPGRLASGN